MVFRIIWSTKAAKQLRKLEKDMQHRILLALDRIKIRPEAYVEKLVSEPGYKFRVGKYRVVMDIERDKLLILILRVGHRKDICK